MTYNGWYTIKPNQTNVGNQPEVIAKLSVRDIQDYLIWFELELPITFATITITLIIIISVYLSTYFGFCTDIFTEYKKSVWKWSRNFL